MSETPQRIEDAKRSLGDQLLVLGHHYQRDEVIRFADYTGDSFKLARDAAAEKEKPYIVFCGVHFMAESADILTNDTQSVILPDRDAGCPMADMATVEQVRVCWEAIHASRDVPTIPVTYMNSTAAIKAFCGENGGIVCTSSNAASVFEWAFQRGERILFIPDEHLGRNTALAFGIPEAETAVWNTRTGDGEGDGESLHSARVILWKGFCHVHMRFSPEHVDAVRREHPGIRVIVHPECTHDVVRVADEAGSTEKIIRAVRKSEPGSAWAIGTEAHLVSRLAAEMPDRTIIHLSPKASVCGNMFKIAPDKLLHVLERLLDGEVVNRITVPPEIVPHARKALERMLAHNN